MTALIPALPPDLALLAIAMLLDLALPELPGFLHPVRWMGRMTAALERMSPGSGPVPQLLAGTLIALAVPGTFAAAAWAAERPLRDAGPTGLLLGAVLLKSTFTVRGLTRAGSQTARLLEQTDLAAARRSLRSLVSRDPSSLTRGQASGAAVESVAENTTDGFIAPWLALALFGLPGAFAYRAINTLDSMIGYRGRYEYLGKVSARLDDAANWLPARLSAALLLCAGALQGLPAARGWQVMRRDRGRTASPNAGWTMSAMSGLLGVRLEKDGHYVLGAEFPEPEPGHIHLSNRTVLAAALLGLAVAALVLLGRHTLGQ